MKKLISILLAAMLVLSLAACSSNENNKDDNKDDNKDEGPAITDALELLTTVWNSYGDDEKFAIMGGDMTEENSVMDAPGKYGLEDTEMVDFSLGLPAASVEKVDDAASIIHMMNANTFTCGAFHVADSDDITAVTDALKENIMARQWMCGFPDKLVIAVVGDYVVSFFGNGEAIDNFKAKLSAAYTQTEIICDEPIVA